MGPVRIYLAARYSKRDELRGYADRIRLAGGVVTSSWLRETADPRGALKDVTEEYKRHHAQQDLWDVDNSDVLVFFAEDQNDQPPRGGRHVEFGFALGCSKSVMVVGEEENIFHYLPSVEHFPTFDALMKELFPNENL